MKLILAKIWLTFVAFILSYAMGFAIYSFFKNVLQDPAGRWAVGIVVALTIFGTATGLSVDIVKESLDQKRVK